MTIEVDNEAVDRLLPSKVETTKSISSDFIPNNLLFRSHVLAQFLGAQHLVLMNALPDDDVRHTHGSTPPPAPPRSGEGRKTDERSGDQTFSAHRSLRIQGRRQINAP